MSRRTVTVETLQASLVDLQDRFMIERMELRRMDKNCTSWRRQKAITRKQDAMDSLRMSISNIETLLETAKL